METTSIIKKRARSANFTNAENQLLVELIEKRKSVIENKQSDGVTWRKKARAWVDLHEEFNCRSGGIHRSLTTLKIKYEGLKRESKKKGVQLRAEDFKTGGVTNPVPRPTGMEEKNSSFTPSSVVGLDTEFDSDVFPDSASKKRCFDQLAQQKLNLVELQKKYLTEEHEWKKAEHKWREEEHQLKMAILEEAFVQKRNLNNTSARLDHD